MSAIYEHILRASQETKTPVSVLRGPSKRRHDVKARWLGIAYARRAGFSLSEIGDFLGGRDHTTILKACQKMGITQ